VIIITEIKTFETPYDPWQMVNYNSPAFDLKKVRSVDGKATMDTKEYIELIKGHRFRRPCDGIDVVIGLPREQQKILGLMYDSFEILEKSMHQVNVDFWRASKALKEMTKKYNEFVDHVLNKTNWWQRIKYLVTKHF